MAKEPIKETEQHSEVKGILLLAITFFILLSSVSFTHQAPASNWLGLVGHLTALGAFYLLGYNTYLLIGFLMWAGWRKLTQGRIPDLALKLFYLMTLLISCGLLLNLCADSLRAIHPFILRHSYSETYHVLVPQPYTVHRCNLGGVPLYYLYRDLPTFNLRTLLSPTGVAIIFSTTTLLSLLFLANIRIVKLLRGVRNRFVQLCTLLSRSVQVVGSFLLTVLRDLRRGPQTPNPRPHPLPPRPTESLLPAPPAEQSLPEPEEADTPLSPQPSSVKISTHLGDRDRNKLSRKARYTKQAGTGTFRHYKLPPYSCLTDLKKVDQPTLKRDLRRQASILEKALLSFGIEARVGKIHCGPAITSFEVHPPVGVKVQKIKALENDLALNLKAKSIRILAPIPGKAAVGVEIPSVTFQEVNFKEMLVAYQKGRQQHAIPLLLGQTVTGEHVTCDLTQMPHCIIAGATGSGKSVCINSIVMSILMTAQPDMVQLLLIDPKKVELSAYSRLPHMIAPVITEAHGASAALNWLVQEMNSRYEVLKKLGIRHIGSFNHRQVDREIENSLGIEIPEKMSYIVVIIDEFADLMMASNSDLETPIARLAQMARAIGIHLILATQRPSREFVTGPIKANFPSRIAFKGSSRVESMIILDTIGSESLLGKGDLLYRLSHMPHSIRAQGVYLRDEDINRVIAHIESQASPNYLIKSFDQIDQESDLQQQLNPTTRQTDPLYAKAHYLVISCGRASSSFLQTKLRIGYARAASLINELEMNKVIGPQEGSRPREILEKQNS